jgi:PAS domain S-box-containing protein
VTAASLRKTGIGFLGDIPWGTHFCHFYETKRDLLQTLLPYFRIGLQEKEFCLWVVAEPLTPQAARNALRRAVPDLGRFIADGSIEIHSGRHWYRQGGALALKRLTGLWDEKLELALARGFAGLRVGGSTAWLSQRERSAFSEYEKRVNRSLLGKRMVALCSYPLSSSGAGHILDVARTHQFALAKRNGKWDVVETPEFRQAKQEVRRLNDELQRRVVERTAQLERVNKDLRKGINERRRAEQELRARDHQLSAVAALGQTAIRAQELTALVKEAAAIVAETLGTEYSAVAERLPNTGDFLVRAGIGWQAGVVGSTVTAGDAPDAVHMLRSDEPVVIADVRAETRFAIVPGLLEHGIRSALAVVVRGRARPWGLVGVYTKRPRAFSSDDIGFLQSVANVMALAVERHEVEAAQRREKETLQAIFDNIPVMIASYDGAGRLLRVNREWERTLGWTLEEAQRLDILAEAYPDPHRRKEVLEFIQRAERRWADFGPRTRDGRVIETSWARFALSDGSRIGFGLDITERKQSERALRESEARFRQLAENIKEVFWLANLDVTEVLYVSPAYERVFGRTRESLYREPKSWLDAIHPDDRDRARCVSFEKGVSAEMDETYRLRRPDGSISWIRDRAFPILDDSGKPYRVAGIAEDITERQHAEEERASLLARETQARAEAEAALERLRAIDAITDTALAHLGLDELLRELLARLNRALDTDAATVFLLDEDGQTLHPRAGYGYELNRSVRVRVGYGVTGLIAAKGQPLVVDDYSRVDVSGIEGITESDLRAAVGSVMGVPLRIGDRVVGVVVVSSERPRRFTDEQLKLLLLVADRAAPAVERARLLEKVREGRERQKALSRRLLGAHEEERRRLAVELHDELGQVLTAVKINLESVERTEQSPVRLKDAIGSVEDALQRVRDLALDLRPAVLDDLGLSAALRWYMDRFARDARIETHVSIDAVPHLQPEVQTASFRVAQEALTNVVRHAHARHVWLDLHFLAEGLELRVRDDGIGFDAGVARQRATAGISMGLLGMQERISLVGGEFEVRSMPGAGTEVRARFVVREKGSGTA